MIKNESAKVQNNNECLQYTQKTRRLLKNLCIQTYEA